MTKSHRDFNPKSFVRKSGVECLRAYINHQSHPLKDDFLKALLEEDLTKERAEDVYELIASENNPNRQADEENLSLINDMASDKAFSFLWGVCKEEGLESLLSEDLNPYQLSFRLFLDHRHVFDMAYAMFLIDYIEGWTIYAGKSLSPLKDDRKSAKQGFTSHVQQYLTQIGFGRALHIDTYEMQDRLILNIRYASPVTRQEDFDKNDKLVVLTLRKPLEIGVVYTPSTGALKVKTPKNQHGLNKSIHQGFALHYLENPKALLEYHTDRVVMVDELKTRRSFPTDAGHQIKRVRVTGLYIKPYGGMNTTLRLHERNDIWGIIETLQIDLAGAEIMEAGIQFQFEGKGRSGSRTVRLNKKNNSVNLNNSKRDDLISSYLKRWNILNV